MYRVGVPAKVSCNLILLCFCEFAIQISQFFAMYVQYKYLESLDDGLNTVECNVPKYHLTSCLLAALHLGTFRVVVEGVVVEVSWHRYLVAANT